MIDLPAGTSLADPRRLTPAMMLLSGLLLLGLLVGCRRGSDAADLPEVLIDPLTVVTESGPLLGVEEEGVRVFRNIPYAAPPVGERRFAPPQSVEPWTEARDASAFGPACPQAVAPASEDRPSLPIDEDCLTLNVFSAAEQGQQLPVMVWIHGGAFRSGSARGATYDGKNFAHDGVVLVSIQYRLGALGFFAHPLLEPSSEGEAWGPYGLMDMVAALEWVKGNIDAFGGDPGRVTIFGESAGGMAVELLMSAPSARGLFSGAIALSGYGTWPLPRAGESEATEIAEGIVERAAAASQVALPTTRAGLRELSAEALARAVQGLHMPIVDGSVLPDEPASVFARGEQSVVPFIAGGDSYDGAVMMMTGMKPEEYLEAFPGDVARVRELYADDFAVSDALGASRLFGDNRYIIASRYLARQMSNAGVPTYLYLYSFVPPARRGEWVGAPHASELTPLFGNSEEPLDAESQAVGEQMRRRFVAFATTDNPNVAGESFVEWPRYSEESDLWLQIDSESKVVPNLMKSKLDYLEGLYEARMAELR